jgi:hypothetical protein
LAQRSVVFIGADSILRGKELGGIGTHPQAFSLRQKKQIFNQDPITALSFLMKAHSVSVIDTADQCHGATSLSSV